MPISNQDSSSLSSYAVADLLIIREPNSKKIKKHSLVKAIILNWLLIILDENREQK